LNRRSPDPLLAMVLVLAGMPLTVACTPTGNGTAFTLDICHPVPTFDTSTGQCTAAAPSRFALSVVPAGFGTVAPQSLMAATRAADAPDPPPPRLPA
jgi:hypothetical protein